jgi:hypothetical protein
MASVNPQRIMSLILVALLLKAVSASGGSLPASLPDNHSLSGKANRSAPKRGADSSIKDQANLGLDLSRLGRRVAGGSVYDMFSGTPKPESGLSSPAVPSGQDPVSSKKQRASRRASNQKTPPSLPVSQAPVVSVPEPAPVVPIEPVVETPPPPPPPPPPPVPTPPFPFKYIGSHHTESGQATYFLTKGNQLYTVEVGQILDTLYSIDGEEGSQLTVTYLPLQRTQTISTGLPQ